MRDNTHKFSILYCKLTPYDTENVFFHPKENLKRIIQHDMSTVACFQLGRTSKQISEPLFRDSQDPWASF